MLDVRSWLLDHMDVVVLGLVGLMVLAIFFFLINTIRLSQLHKRYRTLMKGLKHGNLEELIFQQAAKIEELTRQLSETTKQQSQHMEQIQKSVGTVGVVRFNAFSDVGSDLSFSLAFIDRDGNGAVLSSLFGREEQRTYGKPIEKGQSRYALTDEEKEAIQIAMQHNNK